jgi:sulfate adenylyltransferase
MFFDYVARDLIDASNVIEGLIQYPTTVKSEVEFVKYHVQYPDFHVAIPANYKYFEFDPSDVFHVSPSSVLQSVYGHQVQAYNGFVDAFQRFSFVTEFTVRKEYQDIVDKILDFNQETRELVANLKKSHSGVAAFQTRNIPHLGHEKIMQLMLDHADHLVLNPVIGPKISSDLKIEDYIAKLKPYFDRKYDGRISIRPVIANMYYAGPREAIHHAKLRQRLGFTHFVVGRDHAGSEGCYAPQAAPELSAKYANAYGIEIISHSGAAFCPNCNEVVILGRCGHAVTSLVEISGSAFREKLREGAVYEFADDDLQRILGKI